MSIKSFSLAASLLLSLVLCAPVLANPQTCVIEHCSHIIDACLKNNPSSPKLCEKEPALFKCMGKSKCMANKQENCIIEHCHGAILNCLREHNGDQAKCQTQKGVMDCVEQHKCL